MMSKFFLRFLPLTFLVTLSACQSRPKVQSLPVEQNYGSYKDLGGDVTRPLAIVVSQWHLAPETDARTLDIAPLQAENLLNIEKQLGSWIESGAVSSIVVEGCEGEINAAFKDKFNGWTLADLKRALKEKRGYDSALTHVGLKIKAKYGEKVSVMCGDNAKLIRDHLRTLSDIRGLAGFKLRIESYKQDAKKRLSYVNSVRPVIGLPASASEQTVMRELNSRIKTRIERFKSLIGDRNQSFVKRAKGLWSPVVIVIGALHVPDLEVRLNESGFNVDRFTPIGLTGDDSQLVDELERSLNL